VGLALDDYFGFPRAKIEAVLFTLTVDSYRQTEILSEVQTARSEKFLCDIFKVVAYMRIGFRSEALVVVWVQRIFLLARTSTTIVAGSYA